MVSGSIADGNDEEVSNKKPNQNALHHTGPLNAACGGRGLVLAVYDETGNSVDGRLSADRETS